MSYQLRDLLLSEHFGWILVGSFLYGLTLLPLAGMIRLVTRQLSAETRYWCFLALLLSTAAAPIVASVVSQTTRPPATVAAAMTVDTSGLSAHSNADPGSNAIATDATPTESSVVSKPKSPRFVHHLPWVWLAGSLTAGLFIAMGLAGTGRLRRTSRKLCDSLQNTLLQLEGDYPDLHRIPVMLNERVISPVLIGLIRPMILLPMSATGWDPEVLRFVLLHELAHTKRRDNLVNLLQRFIEALLFFQPAIWLVSSWVRTEREVCCDRYVVGKTETPRTYARLLMEFADQRPGNATILTASSMASHSVVYRITRLLKKEEPMKFSVVWLALMFAALGWFSIPLMSPADAEEKPQSEVNEKLEPVKDKKEETNDDSKPVAESVPEAVEKANSTNSQPSALVPVRKKSEAPDLPRYEMVKGGRTAISSTHEVALSFSVSGAVTTLFVKPGDVVTKGQVVAVLNDQLVKAQLKEARARAKSTVETTFAKLELSAAELRLKSKQMANKRVLDRGRPTLYTPDEIRELELEVVKAEAGLDRANENQKLAALAVTTKEIQLKQLTLVSPTAGVVTAINVAEGSAILAEDPVMTIVDPSILSMTCWVAAKNIHKIKRGMRVEFRPNPDLKLKPIQGRVIAFGAAAIANAENSTEVICELHNPHEHVREGTFGEGVFFIAEPTGAEKTPPVDESSATTPRAQENAE